MPARKKSAQRKKPTAKRKPTVHKPRNSPNPPGQPRIVLTPEQLIQLEAYAAVLTQDEACEMLGIVDRTLRRRMQEDPQVLSAYRRGRLKAKTGVGGGLLTLARNGDREAAKFYLRTQCGWKETVVIESVDLDKLSDAELEAIAAGKPISAGR